MISYCGVTLQNLTPAQDAFVRHWLDPRILQDLARPGWPGRNLTELPFPFLERDRRPQINSLFWPVGASRWAVAYCICTDAELTQIRSAVYPSIIAAIVPPNEILANGTVNSGGTGYVVGDQLTLDGGDFVTPAVLQVLTVSATAVTSFAIIDPGFYQTVPMSPVSVTGGVGGGFKIDADFFPAPGSVAVTGLVSAMIDSLMDGGTGYTVGDHLTLQGGQFNAAARVIVTGVASGQVTTVEVLYNGSYFTAPSPANAVDVAGGTGIGCILDCTFGAQFIAGPYVQNDIQQSISTNLYMLPPRPLVQCFNVPNGIPTVPPIGSSQPFALPDWTNGLWLLTLVDDRYHWWERSDEIEVPDCPFALAFAAIKSGGTNYAIDDELTFSGGTFDTPAKVIVDKIATVGMSTGIITGVTIIDSGCYSVVPTDPISVTGGLGTGATFNGLWLTPWEQLISAIARTLGVTVSFPLNIPTQYLRPAAALTNYYDRTPILFDAVAYSIGMRVVRGLDGSVQLQNAANAQTSWQQQFAALKVAGGNILLDGTQPTNDTPALLPKSVQVSYGLTKNTFPDCPPYLSVVDVQALRLASLTQPPCQYIDSKFFHSTCAPGYSTTGVLQNKTELDDLAIRLTKDWIAWQLAPLDVIFSGTVPWIPEGMHDLLWEYVGSNMVLRVSRAPWNEWDAEVLHAGTYGSTFYAQIAALVTVDSSTLVGNFYPGSITQYDPVTNTFTEGQPCWVLDLVKGFPVVVASANLTAQSGAVASVMSFTPSVLSTYRVSMYLNVTAITTDVLAVQVSYTDENNVAQTIDLFPPGATVRTLSAVQNYTLAPATIRCNPVPITVKTILTTSGGSDTYDCGGVIEQLTSN